MQMHDLDAEIGLLSACLQHKSARIEARKRVTGTDFYLPWCEDVYDAMTYLDKAGIPVDAITVGTRLQEAGANRLTMENYPSLLSYQLGLASSASYYAETVHEWGIRRRIHAAAVGLAEKALQPEEPAGKLATQAVTTLSGIRDGHGADTNAKNLGDILSLADVAPSWVIPGLLEVGDRLMLTGTEGVGKALAVDTPIPTPKGWVTMGDLTSGDMVFSPSGAPVQVIAATDVMFDRPCYRVTFSDGSKLVADEEHLWLTETLAARESAAKAKRRPDGPVKPKGSDQRHKRKHFPEVVTTKAIAETLMARNGHALNHSVDTTNPLEYDHQEQPMHPYALGAWLGDGTSAAAVITSEDDMIPRLIEEATGWRVTKRKDPYSYSIRFQPEDYDQTKRRPCRCCGATTRGLWCAPCRSTSGSVQGLLRGLGVLGNKHIPDLYLYGSVTQRIALLQGLMDTDGSIDQRGLCEFSVVNEHLAQDLLTLVHGLGIKAVMNASAATLNGRVVGTRYRIVFVTDLPVFRLPRKLARMKPLRTRRGTLRYITSVEPIDSVPVRCIQVANEDGMFVAGRECIPTHNSALSRQLLIMAAAGLHPFTNEMIPPQRVLFIDAENKENQVRRQAAPLVRWLQERGADPVPNTTVDALYPRRINLTSDRDLSMIHQTLDAYKPSLVFIGPIYKMSPRALQTDDDAHPFLAALDTITERGCALVVEAHAGHSHESTGTRGATARGLRPRGSSALLGWPEFGLGLRNLGNGYADLERWRGDREERGWPSRLRRSPGNRWEEVHPDHDPRSDPVMPPQLVEEPPAQASVFDGHWDGTWAAPPR